MKKRTRQKIPRARNGDVTGSTGQVWTIVAGSQEKRGKEAGVEEEHEKNGQILV